LRYNGDVLAELYSRARSGTGGDSAGHCPSWGLQIFAWDFPGPLRWCAGSHVWKSREELFMKRAGRRKVSTPAESEGEDLMATQLHKKQKGN
jgi:hypothetical protein